MKQLKELEKKYEELGAEIEKLKAEQDEEWPKVGDRYWTAVGDGSVYRSIWDNDNHDNYRLATGDCHRTKEAAEAYRAWLTAPRTQARRMVEMCDRFDPLGSWQIFTYSSDSKSLLQVWASEGVDAGLTFSSESQALAAIDKLGEDLIKVALGVITGDEARDIVLRAMRKV